MASDKLSWLELMNNFRNHGALLIPFVSKLIGARLAQVYMAERAFKGAA